MSSRFRSCRFDAGKSMDSGPRCLAWHYSRNQKPACWNVAATSARQTSRTDHHPGESHVASQTADLSPETDRRSRRQVRAVGRRVRVFPVNPVSARSRSYGREKPLPPSRTSAAMTRLTVAASARVAGYAGGDALMCLPILSWILWEFLHGCAAYAQAMYPPVEAFDHELEFAELEAAQPVAPVRPRSVTTIAAGKPRLTIAASNHPSAATSRSGQR